MKRCFPVICLIAAGLFAVQANAQSLTTEVGSTIGGPYNSDAGPIAFNPDVLTQSNDMSAPVAGSVSCNTGGLHDDNSYLRRFDTSVLPTGFTAKELDMAVEQATGAGGTQPIVVNVYSIADAAAFTFANLTLEGSSGSFPVPDQSLTLLSVPVVATVPAGDDLVVEIFTPEGQTAGNSFFVGSNPNGQTDPSFLAAAACGIAEPTDTGAIGFPNMHLMMALHGSLAPVGLEPAIETPGSHVLSAAYPNPFNPQSNFTLAVAQDQQVTAELFNTLGQRVAVLFSGTVEANQTQLVTIDGAGLASGMYVVRVNGELFNDALRVTLLK